MKGRCLLAALVLCCLGVFQVSARAQDAEEELLTQGTFAIQLVRDIIRVEFLLPPNAVADDYAELLSDLGIVPCEKIWMVDKELTSDDLCCILGEEPGCIIAVGEEFLREKLFDEFQELFWLGTEPRQPVSPFAP